MELKIGSQELARALGRSQGIVERKSTMPILSHVLLEARKGTELHLSATDLDLSVTSQHACEVAKDGALAVSAKHLYEIVRALPEQTVTPEAGRQQLPRGEERPRPSSASSASRPRTSRRCPASRRSTFVDIDPEVAPRPDRPDLLRRLQRRDPLQPERRLLRAAGAGAAAGGHRRPPAGRLGAAAGRVTSASRRGSSCRRRGCRSSASCSPRPPTPAEEKPMAQLGFAENSAVFRRPGVSLVMRLIEGLFPDYKQVIPKPGEKIVTLGRVRFLETLRRVSLLASDKSHAVKLELSAGTAARALAEPGPGRRPRGRAGRVRRRPAQDRLQRALPDRRGGRAQGGRRAARAGRRPLAGRPARAPASPTPATPPS